MSDFTIVNLRQRNDAAMARMSGIEARLAREPFDSRCCR